MKKLTRNRIAILVLIVMLIASISTIVSAHSVTMSLSSSSKLKEGSTVVVKVNLGTIDAGDGIDTIVGQLDYNKNVFEVLDASSITAENNWVPTFAPSTNMITLIKTSKTTAGEAVLTITFKVKADISDDSTKISLKDITASGGRVADGGTGDIDVADASVVISREVEQQQPVEQKPAEQQPVVQTNTVVKDNTVIKAKLPKTGIDTMGLIAIAVVAIVGTVCFIVYKKIEKVVK